MLSFLFQNRHFRNFGSSSKLAKSTMAKGSSSKVTRSSTVKSLGKLISGPTTIGGRRLFRNFQEAHGHYQYPWTHRTGTIGNAKSGVIRSYSANHMVPSADGTMEWKDRFDFGNGVGKVPTRIHYRLKNAEIKAWFESNREQGKALRFFKKLDKSDACEKMGPEMKEMKTGVWDLGLYEVKGFAEIAGTVKGTEFVRLEQAEKGVFLENGQRRSPSS